MPHAPLTPATGHKTSAEGKEQRNVLPTRIDTHKHTNAKMWRISISFTALNLDERRSETYTDAGLKPAVLATDNASK